MRAAVVDEIPAERFRIADLADLTPQAPDDVVVRVGACGICGTDIHILDGLSYRPQSFPFVLGHEPVGTAVAAGQEALEWVGRRVTVTLFRGCGRCAWCRAGDERVCPELRDAIGALGHWGGFAELLMVSASQLVDVPAPLSSPEAAALVDAGATAANSVRVIDRIPEMPVVVGGGPVGFIVAELLRSDGRSPIIIQRGVARATVLQRLGYDVVTSIGEYTGAPDVVIDCTGDPTVLPWALGALRPRGLVVVAAYSVVAAMDTAPIARKELSIRGVRSGSRADLVQVLDAAASGRIRLPPLDLWTLPEIDDAIAALRTRRVAGKAIIQLTG